jgi:hypothetical protein
MNFLSIVAAVLIAQAVLLQRILAGVRFACVVVMARRALVGARENRLASTKGSV